MARADAGTARGDDSRDPATSHAGSVRDAARGVALRQYDVSLVAAARERVGEILV